MAAGHSGALRAIAGGTLIVALLGSCTTAHPVTPSPAPRTSQTTAASSANCPDVTGQNAAAAGDLSIGPFDADQVGPPPPGQRTRKLWVASERPGRDTAVLEVTDPEHHTVTQRRPAGQAFAEGVAQFYPGTIRTPQTGSYQLRLTISQETMCVLVRYQL
jgi:hypothetical protein